jgi:U3 small nucleolar RNA-associated protein 14
MSSDEEDYSSVDPKAHKKLLSEINEIVKIQHIRKPVRTEPALKNSEFHLVKTKSYADSDETSKKKTVSIANVVDVLKKNTKQKKVGKQLKDVFKNDNVIAKPLEKIHADKIQRTIAYDNTKEKLGRWDAVVTKNRAAEQLTFPLDQSKASFKSNKEVSQFRYKTKMMQEMEDLRNEYYPKSTEPEEPETPVELLTIQELKQRRKEFARLKMRESNQIIKKRMQGKIKSKKYHKLKKRDEMKRKIKEFEDLKATNPELALKELEKIEKQRVKERTTLRHKNTGTWAKNQMVKFFNFLNSFQIN